MKGKVKKEVEKLIEEFNLNCSEGEFRDKVVEWADISCFFKLSLSFIREFSDKVNWYFICEHQKLSETIIREFEDKVHWDSLQYHQKLSEYFIYEFRDRLNINMLINTGKITLEKIREFERKERELVRYSMDISHRFEIMDIQNERKS